MGKVAACSSKVSHLSQPSGVVSTHQMPSHHLHSVKPCFLHSSLKAFVILGHKNAVSSNPLVNTWAQVQKPVVAIYSPLKWTSQSAQVPSKRANTLKVTSKCASTLKGCKYSQSVQVLSKCASTLKVNHSWAKRRWPQSVQVLLFYPTNPWPQFPFQLFSPLWELQYQSGAQPWS